MNTRKSKFFTVGALLLAAAVLAGVGVISNAFAAPHIAPSGSIRAAPMAALPEATCTLIDTTRTCELWALSGALIMPDATSVPVWGFADNAAGPAQVPGPVIRANVGETLEIILHNDLPGETVSLAFPGMETIPDLEGVPTGSATLPYSFALSQAGTYLYEAGLTPGGTRQVAMGLFGVLVVEPSGAVFDQEEILVFSEIDTAFNSDPLNFSMFHFSPEYWLINGQVYPDTGYIEVPAGNTLLVRYLNAGVEHRTIGLLGLSQQVIAANGETLFAPRGAVAEPLAPGDVKEALVSVPASDSTGTLYPLYNASLHQHNNNQRLVDGRAAFGGMLTFLRVTAGGDPGGAGPIASGVTVTPSKTDGSVDVTLSATLTDDDNVVAYEYFVDTLGAPGTGTVTAAGPASPITVDVLFTSAELAGWSNGEHVLYIRGQDGLGNWGTPGSAALYLDKAGPSISGMNLNPNPTNGSVDVLLSATADDRANGDSLVVAAEYSLDGGINWLPMNLSTTGTSVKGLTATILSADVAGLGEGIHPITVRAQDEWGNWSEPAGATNLNLDLTGPGVTAASLNPNVLDFNQPLPVTFVRLTATVDDRVGPVPSNLANAEGFIDTQGAPGTGFDLYPADGLFDEPFEDVYYNIPVSSFASLTPGVHQVLVVGKDKAGNWGPAGAAPITIVAQGVDATGPTITGLTASPNPTAGSRRVTLTAVATDTQSNVVGAVWFIGTNPANVKTYRMTATDGRFDSLSEAITATINVGNWQAGTYQISVIAIDAAGNWGPIVTINLVVN